MYSTMQLYIYIYNTGHWEWTCFANFGIQLTLEVFKAEVDADKATWLDVCNISYIYIYYVMIIITLFQCVSIPMDAHV